MGISKKNLIEDADGQSEDAYAVRLDTGKKNVFDDVTSDGGSVMFKKDNGDDATSNGGSVMMRMD